jgi:hypothetical protein
MGKSDPKYKSYFLGTPRKNDKCEYYLRSHKKIKKSSKVKKA